MHAAEVGPSAGVDDRSEGRLGGRVVLDLGSDSNLEYKALHELASLLAVSGPPGVNEDLPGPVDVVGCFPAHTNRRTKRCRAASRPVQVCQRRPS